MLFFFLSFFLWPHPWLMGSSIWDHLLHSSGSIPPNPTPRGRACACPLCLVTAQEVFHVSGSHQPAGGGWVFSISLICMSISHLLYFCNFFFYLFYFFVLQHTELPRLGVQLELQLPAYSTATATPDPSHVLQPTPQLMASPDP